MLVLQLVGCAVDLTSEQAGLETILCMVTRPENLALELAGLAIWLALALSWIVGMLAIGFARLRPVYWTLLLMIPIAVVTQNVLLQKEIIFCGK